MGTMKNWGNVETILHNVPVVRSLSSRINLARLFHNYFDTLLFIKSTIMKKICGKINFRLWFIFLLSFMSISLWAQDSTSSTNKVITSESTTTTTTEWYTQPWVWIAGGAVFIIIIVALVRGNSSRNTSDVSRTTTIIKDRDR